MCCQHKPERPDANVRKNRTMPANRISPLHALPRGSQAWQFRAVSRLRDSDFRVRPSRGASPVTELGFQNVAYGGASAADFHRVPLPETDINFSGKNRYLGGQKKSSIKENFTKKTPRAPRDRTPRPYPSRRAPPKRPARRTRATQIPERATRADNSHRHTQAAAANNSAEHPPRSLHAPARSLRTRGSAGTTHNACYAKAVNKKTQKMLEKKCAPHSKNSATALCARGAKYEYKNAPFALA